MFVIVDHLTLDFAQWDVCFSRLDLFDQEDRLICDYADPVHVAFRFVEISQIEGVADNLVFILTIPTCTQGCLCVAINWIISWHLKLIVNIAWIAEPLNAPLVALDLVLQPRRKIVRSS